MASVPETDISQLQPGQLALLHAETNMPPDVVFTRARPRSIKDLVGWAVLCFGGLMVGVVSALMWKEDIWDGHLTRASSDTASTELAFAVIGIVVGIGSAFGIMEDLRRLVEQSRGDPNRYGLFLGRDTLILRVNRSSCTLLPRARILKCEMANNGKDVAGAKVGTIYFRADDGSDSTLRLPDDLAEVSSHDSVVRTINDWLSADGLSIADGPSGTLPLVTK